MYGCYNGKKSKINSNSQTGVGIEEKDVMVRLSPKSRFYIPDKNI